MRGLDAGVEGEAGPAAAPRLGATPPPVRPPIRKRGGGQGWRLTGNLVQMAVCAILAGVVTAAVAFPPVAAGGIGAKKASDSFQQLPTDLGQAPLAQTSIVYAKDDTVVTTFFDQNRVSVPLAEVAPVMRQAIIAAEDARFYEHRGVDLQGVLRALVVNQQGGEVSQGASTLTQQYVRQYLVYTARSDSQRIRATERKPARKLREMRYAMALEQSLSKDQILENYLNTVYFGGLAYGIHSAARTYFSKTPAELNVGEAALLAGLVKSPGTDSPIDGDAGRAKVRRDYTLDRMAAIGYLTPAQLAAAKEEPIQLRRTPVQASCATGRANFGFACDWFLAWWRANPAFGKTPNARELALRRGGYRIHLAVDPRMQSFAQRASDAHASRKSRFATGIVLVEPGTGRVRAMAVTRTFSLAKNPGNRSYPNTVNPLLTGSGVSPGYQAGSTFKMFTMVAALNRGMPLATKISSPTKYRSKVFLASGPASCGGYYCPSNASPRMAGTHDMWSGFGESVNTYFMQLEERVTVKAAVQAAERLGVVFRSTEDLANKASVQRYPNGGWGSFTLGTAQVSPLHMANAYATVAARGKACTPLPVESIVDQHGTPHPAAKPSCRQAIPVHVADAAADAARCPVGN
ncbi:MAG TPA: transglycosylase domain-containing protein, partial [Cryptosporangiaceae bacterium]|nr:transglycosylase domain-containing protein [Cryptosporangiaceae bacterium]